MGGPLTCENGDFPKYKNLKTKLCRHEIHGLQIQNPMGGGHLYTTLSMTGLFKPSDSMHNLQLLIIPNTAVNQWTPLAIL